MQKGQIIFLRNKVRELTLADFRSYYKVIINKKMWYWWEDIFINQWNKIYGPEKDPHIQVQLICNKDVKSL